MKKGPYAAAAATAAVVGGTGRNGASVAAEKAAPNKRLDAARAQKVVGPAALVVSPSLRVARKRARKANSKGVEECAEVVRSMRAILNKFTVERFGPLYQQLIGCGIRRVEQVEIIMREVFEKAAIQQQFVGMYAQLCAQDHAWFVGYQVGGG